MLAAKCPSQHVGPRVSEEMKPFRSKWSRAASGAFAVVTLALLPDPSTGEPRMRFHSAVVQR